MATTTITVSSLSVSSIGSSGMLLVGTVVFPLCIARSSVKRSIHTQIFPLLLVETINNGYNCRDMDGIRKRIWHHLFEALLVYSSLRLTLDRVLFCYMMVIAFVFLVVRKRFMSSESEYRSLNDVSIFVTL